MSDFVALNGVYAKHFSQPFPARTTIAVAALPLGPALRSTSSSRLELARGA